MRFLNGQFLNTVSEHTIRYQNAFSLNGFALLIEVSNIFPTRINKATGSISCIDHVLTDFHLYDLSCAFQFYLFDFIAGHKTILLNVTSEKSKPQKNQYKIRGLLDLSSCFVPKNFYSNRIYSNRGKESIQNHMFCSRVQKMYQNNENFDNFLHILPIFLILPMCFR
ncbi:hypothetical protein ACKWTF_002207 [Chironomus riparius]